jgi:hypothetical protein
VVVADERVSRRTLRRTGLALATALSLVLVAAAPARAFEIAVQDDPTFLYGSRYDRELAFAQAKTLGARVVRVNMIWADWKRLGPEPWDSVVDRAGDWGMRVHLTLLGNPRFYYGGNRRLTYWKPSAGRMGAWAAEVADHFYGRVRRYSIWNEPNIDMFLGPQRDAPRLYRNLYKAAYRAIKVTDPGAQVLIGELFSGYRRPPRGHAPMSFLNATSRNLRADGLAYHPFQFTTPPNRRSTSYLGLADIPTIQRSLSRLRGRRQLRTPRGRTLPIYFTEFGYQIQGSFAIRPESRRASWTVDAFRIAKRRGVRSMAYFHLVRSFALGGWDSGIVNTNGSVTPSYAALRRARRSLVGF